VSLDRASVIRRIAVMRSEALRTLLVGTLLLTALIVLFGWAVLPWLLLGVGTIVLFDLWRQAKRRERQSSGGWGPPR
jgi:fatty acid desaturase